MKTLKDISNKLNLIQERIGLIGVKIENDTIDRNIRFDAWKQGKQSELITIIDDDGTFRILN